MMEKIRKEKAGLENEDEGFRNTKKLNEKPKIRNWEDNEKRTGTEERRTGRIRQRQAEREKA